MKHEHPHAEIGRRALERVKAMTQEERTEGVTELSEIWNGAVDVQFEIDDTKNIFAVGNAVIDDNVSGRSVEFDPTFDFSLLNTADVDKLLNGSFKVMIGGPVAAPFDSKGAEAEFQLTFEFSAYE